MITEVLIQPNPFTTSFNLEITSEQSKHTIIRLFNPDGRITKMFSWFLVKGTNITNITDMKPGSTGTHRLDIIDNEGMQLFSAEIIKED